MGAKSFLLIALLVFGMIFSLLYASSYVQDERSHYSTRVLESKKADASLFRLVNPEPVCFTLHDEDLNKYTFLPIMLKEADSFVTDGYPSIHENRYDGYGMRVNSSEAVSLVKAFESRFNHTVENRIIDGYNDDFHLYDCNFEYIDYQYYLRLELKSLTALDRYSGFVPISVMSEGISATVSSARLFDESSNHFRTVTNPVELNMFNTFNNTLVWSNNVSGDSSSSSSWVKLTLNATGFDDENIIVSTQIPPGKSWDYRLSPNYRSLDPTVYEYAVEGDKVRTTSGRIYVHSYPSCMDQQEARSLYGQSGIYMRFPTYLPEGYEYKCGVHYDHFLLLQLYWNQDINDLETLNYLSSNTEEASLNDGLIRVFAAKAVPFWHDHLNTTAEERLEELTSGENSRYYLQPRIVEIEHTAANQAIDAVAYQRNFYSWKDINILEVYDHEQQEAYVLKGKVPLEELVSMAQSMFQ